MSVHVTIERGDRDPATGRRCWRVVDNDHEPTDYNYWGTLVDGCETLPEALTAAVEYGCVPGGGDSAACVPVLRRNPEAGQ